MDKKTKNCGEYTKKNTWSGDAQGSGNIFVYSPHIFNNFNLRQITLNKHYFKSFVILVGYVTLIWQFAFLTMVHGNIQDIYIMLQTLD